MTVRINEHGVAQLPPRHRRLPPHSRVKATPRAASTLARDPVNEPRVAVGAPPHTHKQAIVLERSDTDLHGAERETGELSNARGSDLR